MNKFKISIGDWNMVVYSLHKHAKELNLKIDEGNVGLREAMDITDKAATILSIKKKIINTYLKDKDDE